MSTTDRWSHNYLALAWDLILVGHALATIQELDRLLLAWGVLVDLHVLVRPDAIQDATRATMITNAALAADISWWQLAIAVRVLRLIFVEHAPLIVCILLDHVHRLLLVADLAVLGGKHGHLVVVA